MDTELVFVVKKEIEQVFGRKIISSRDCNALCEEVFYKTGFKLNANTLRRFFGLVKASYAPSSGTLEILCNYCGCKSSEELKNLHEGEGADDINLKAETVLYYLLYPFKNIHLKKENDETFISLIRGVIIFINRYPQLANRFNLEIAKTKNGQIFYFEEFVNYDKLNSFYGNGLHYYLAEKKSVDAQIFGHSLLVFRYWLTKETDKLDKHYIQLKNLKPGKHNQPATCGRHFASRLFYAHAHGFNTHKILAEAHRFYSGLTADQNNCHLYNRFEYFLSHALILIGNYEEASTYIVCINKPEAGKVCLQDTPYYHTFTLYETLLLYKNNSQKQAEKIFTDIKASEFYFLSKKFNTILYLWISRYFKRTVSKTDEQLKALIEETGFVRLHENRL